MRNWRRNLVRIGIGTAATAAFLWLFLREVDLGEAWREITALPGWTMVVALALVVANVLIMAVRWGYLLAGAGFQIGLWKLFSTVAVGRGANNILPARGGDLLRIESMRERQVPVFVSAGTLFAERLLDGVILSAWILFGALAIGQGGPMLLTGIALSAGAALGVVLVALAARDPDGAERFAWRATRRLPPRWHTRFTRAAAHFVDGLGAFRGRSRLVAIFGTSAAMWLADVAMYWVVGEFAFELDLPHRRLLPARGHREPGARGPGDRGRDRDVRLPDAPGREGHRRQPGQGDRVRADDARARRPPGHDHGRDPVSPAFPRLLGRRREPAQESG